MRFRNIFCISEKQVFLTAILYCLLPLLSSNAQTVPSLPYSSVLSGRVNYTRTLKSFGREKFLTVHHRLAYSRLSDTSAECALWMKRDVAGDYIIIGDSLFWILPAERKIAVESKPYISIIDDFDLETWVFAFGLLEHNDDLFKNEYCTIIGDTILGLRRGSCTFPSTDKNIDSTCYTYSLTFPECTGSMYERINWGLDGFSRITQVCDSGGYSMTIDTQLIADIRAYLQTLRDSGYSFETSKSPERPVSKLSKGLDFPNIEFRDSEGKVYDPFSDPNKLVLMDFWYLGCPPCVMNIPSVSAVHDKYKDSVLVIGVNPYDEGKHVSLRRFNDRCKPTYTSYFFDRKVLKEIGHQSFPTHVLVRNRKILGVHIGLGSPEYMILENLSTVR